jgi:hypothetical protein
MDAQSIKEIFFDRVNASLIAEWESYHSLIRQWRRTHKKEIWKEG